MELIRNLGNEMLYRCKIKIAEYPNFDLYQIIIKKVKVTEKGTQEKNINAYKECINK